MDYSEVIKFSNNWNNKLSNKAFTTIRIHNQVKYCIGNRYLIDLKGESKGIAILKDKRILTIDKLNEFICHLDTGYSKEETINILLRMYPKIDVKTCLFDFCLLVYV